MGVEETNNENQPKSTEERMIRPVSEKRVSGQPVLLTEDVDAMADQQAEQHDKKEHYSEYWERFVANLTLHGYIQFHEAVGIRKVLWGIILFIMSCMVILLIVETFRTKKLYQQNIELDIQYDNNIDFPTVSICNFNPVYFYI